MAEFYIQKELLTADLVDNQVLEIADANGVSSINLHVKSLTTLTYSALSLKIQFSPLTDGDLWIDTSVTVTPSLTNGVVVSGTSIANLIARRVRVLVSKTGVSTGTIQVVALGR
jgi:hypothetical protein